MGRARPKQKEIVFRTWGGKRRGAGRKPNGERAGVSHAARPALSGREPVLVTLKVRRDVWNLRGRRALATILAALANLMAKPGVRVVHYSVQRDHIHLIVEADGAHELSRRIGGLCTSLARRLNALMKRTGKVFADRFHQHVLTTPRQVRHALRYVLLNARKHGLAPSRRRWLDPCSSASAFDGWAIDITALVSPAPAPPTSAARTWLLKIGWRRGGAFLDPGERPGPLAD
jgi:REP element-mobilizing transposase RayT